jgi:hypothetical protein
MIFQPKEIVLNRSNIDAIEGLKKLLDDLFEKMGVEKVAREKMTKAIVGLCIRDPKLLPRLLMNLTDKKNNAVIKCLLRLGQLAKDKDYQLKTNFELVLKFLLLSPAELKAEHKKDPLLLKKMQLELKELVYELKQIAPEKIPELDKLLLEVNQALDKQQEELNQPQKTPAPAMNVEDPEQRNARIFFESLHGFSRFGGYMQASMSGVTNSAGISDDNELGVEKDLEGPLDWLAEHVFGLDSKPQGVLGDTLDEIADLNKQQTEEPEEKSPFKSPWSLPKLRPPGSLND